jgi:cellulose synthase/poly-beta-1,6-N-acetylglucosamine synthase-like glycosyltransferase
MILGVNLIFPLLCASQTQSRPRYELIGNESPSIDVFITCCGEPLDVILDTVTAATALNYPKTKFKVFVLDDSQDEVLRTEVGRAGKKMENSDGPQLIYLSRRVKVGVQSYFKAGNLQFGIEESNARSGSQYIASLDADMIPEPKRLRKAVPHLILGDKIAIVAPSQASIHSDFVFQLLC